MLPSSEVELTFTILVVDTTVPPQDPPPLMDVLADIIIAHFPDERIFLANRQFQWGLRSTNSKLV